MAWVVKLLGGPNVWGRQIRRMTGALGVHRELWFFVSVESLHFHNWGTECSSAVSLGVHYLRLWDFAHRYCYGCQAAWRPGASVDERCGQLLGGTSEGAANMPQPAGVGLREGLRRRGISH